MHSKGLDFKLAADFISSALPASLKNPKIGIICGSGLGGLSNTLQGEKVELPYESIPGFVKSTVVGHEGKLVFGFLGKHNTPAIFMVGRFHFYEGHSLQETTFPVRVMKLLGIETLIVTNAAGSLNPSFKVGDVTLIADHISLPGMAGMNPLIGQNLSDFGVRFPATSDAYDFSLRKLAFRAAHELGFPDGIVKDGVYCFVAGPSYETKAEARFLRMIGGDVVGMSTVPEVIVARHSSIAVLGLSLVTNSVVMGRGLNAPREALREMGIKVEFEADNDQDEEGAKGETKASHEEVLAASADRAREMQALVRRIVELIAEGN